LLGFLTGLKVCGQKVTGIVTDKATKRPVSGAMVSIGNLRTMTDLTGRFEIAAAGAGDSLKIVHFNYQTYTVAIDKTTPVLLIELKPKVNQLNEVTVHGTRSFKQDSLENRGDFAKELNYTGPKLKDIFTADNTGRPGVLVSVNLLMLAEVLTKKSTPQYKFKQKLIGDEHEQYVDGKFNRGNVSRITELKGDTLAQFLTQYRPDYQFALKATGYDMEVYIKECFEKFKKGGVDEANPFAVKD
jgi:hypothetical protein